MSERAIFLGALDREDPAERAAYLDRAWLPESLPRTLQKGDRDNACNLI